MNNRDREWLLEKFEVINRTSDDCVYILEDYDLDKEALEHKLHVRLIRIKEEVEALDKIVSLLFEPAVSLKVSKS